MELETLYRTYQPLLYSIAYRMLGSVTDAEDIVQDLFLEHERIPLEHIQHIKAYLIKTVTNRCINLLNSARKKREIYTGPWLPEPVINLETASPEETMIQDESISYAMMVVMEQLNPVERAVFLLREVLAYEYTEIAEALAKSEANCRKIYSRVKQKLQQEGVLASPANKTHDKIIQQFLTAAKSGNFAAFVDLLREDAVMVTDGGGKVRAAIFPILGKQRVMAFFEGVGKKGFFDGENRLVSINGKLGILQTQHNQPVKALNFQLDMQADGSLAIRRIYMVSNPDKLQHIRLA